MAGNTMHSESDIRTALRSHLGDVTAVEEFWVPVSNERVDLVTFDAAFAAFEIKSHRDTLVRLPRQVAAFSQVFDLCTAVIATRHLERAREIVPSTWGLIEVPADDALRVLRRARPSGLVDVEVLVRFLRRDEARSLLASREEAPAVARASRQVAWRLLLREFRDDELVEAITATLRQRRDAMSAGGAGSRPAAP